MPNFFRTNCREFRPERPCEPHKERGLVCRNCHEFKKATPRLLLLKVGALGDVLRTTALLPAIRNRFPNAHITWVTQERAFDLFDNTTHVDRLLPFSWETFVRLKQDVFDEMWCLDFDPTVASWAPDIQARKKRGFTYINGTMLPLNPEARGWAEMSMNDELKRANKRTYQDWMFQICGLSGAERFQPSLLLTDSEKAWARNHVNLRGSAITLGLNTGAGNRWAQKKWPRQGIDSLLRLLKKETGVRILLLGGPDEEDLNRSLAKSFPWTVHTGCNHDLRRFASLVDLCSVVVSADTLAMHVAIALQKRVVALFGPTSAAEIALYGRGEKLSTNWQCLPCYRRKCTQSPNCMDALGAEQVAEAIRRQLKKIRERRSST